MKILISAAEASSDAHGAELLRALQKELSGKEKLEAFGIGGSDLQASGLEAIVDARELLVMGTSEILLRLPKIYRALNALAKAAEERKPDVAVVIDYPDFHFRLAKKLHRLGIPVIYYIPPKVWIWRKGRIQFLKKYFSKILSIFPFEVEFYQKENVPVKYVGNPLVDELPMQMTRPEARKNLGLSLEEKVLVLMAGSRPAELKRHLIPMLDAAAQASQKLGHSLKILMPFPKTVALASMQTQVDDWRKTSGTHSLEISLSQGDSAECLIAADVGLIKSGTSTLEAGLLRCCHSVIYKPSGLTAWIFKNLVRYSGPVGLVNLITGWKKGQQLAVREILCEQVTAQALADEVVSLLTDSDRRQKMQAHFVKVRETVLGGQDGEGKDWISPSGLAAREVLKTVWG